MGLVLVLAGCGAGKAGDLPAKVQGPAFVQADVDFAVNMGQHHAQSLEMAEPAKSKAQSSKVKALAAAIVGTQADEIDVFGTWMTAWSEAGATMPPHGLDGHTFPGMTDSKDIDALQALTGKAFDRRFLSLMIRHERAALKLAEHESAEGKNPDATRVATVIHVAATQRIAAMQVIQKTSR